MVGIPSSHGPESQNYFSTKNKVSKAGGGEPRGKKPQPSSKPFSQHNGQASPQPHHTKQHPVKPKFPSGQKQSRQNSSPKPILNNKNNSHARQLPNSLRCSPAPLAPRSQRPTQARIWNFFSISKLRRRFSRWNEKEVKSFSPESQLSPKNYKMGPNVHRMIETHHEKINGENW